MPTDTPVNTITEQLAQRLLTPVPQTARDCARFNVLDWIACAWAGTRTETGRTLLAWARRSTDSGDYCTIGTMNRSREVAIVVNGGLGNILEMDDLHRTAILHPGPVVIPALLGAAGSHPETPISGARFLDAVVRGYEAMIRVGRSFGPGHYRHWHNTATAGPFGAAAAVASLLGADSKALVDALGNAGTQSAGLWQTRHEPSMSKQLHTGRAAHSGLLAAEMAAAGFTGPHAILEGESGLYRAMCPDPLPALVNAQPDAPWLIQEMSFKPWPACRHAHPTIDAALLLRDRVDTSQIESITVQTYEEAVRFCDKLRPQTELEAKFSLQHVIALVMLNGSVQLDDFAPAIIGAPEVQVWRERVTVESDTHLSRNFPARYGAVLQVKLKSGEHVSIECLDALGDPDKPMSADELLAKSRRLQAWAGLREQSSAALEQAVMELSEQDSITPLLDLLAQINQQYGQ